MSIRSIVFGTSYPVRKEWLTQGAAFVEALDITREEKDMILSQNAMGCIISANN